MVIYYRKSDKNEWFLLYQCRESVYLSNLSVI